MYALGKRTRNVRIMMKKIFCVIALCTIMVGCSARYGLYINHMRRANHGSAVLVNEDHSFAFQSWHSWWEINSIGKWESIQNKRNSILLKSNVKFDHIPMQVEESSNGREETYFILEQGTRFFNCEYNELFINGKSVKIDQDTIIISCDKVDSISILLGYSEQARKSQAPVLQYPCVQTYTYIPHNHINNVYKINLPTYPICVPDIRADKRASSFFWYVPMETEAYYRCGKWYLIDKNGKPIPYKRMRKRKERKED